MVMHNIVNDKTGMCCCCILFSQACNVADASTDIVEHQ